MVVALLLPQKSSDVGALKKYVALLLNITFLCRVSMGLFVDVAKVSQRLRIVLISGDVHSYVIEDTTDSYFGVRFVQCHQG